MAKQGKQFDTKLIYDYHDAAGSNSGNSRNGHTSKTLKAEHGELPVNVPRDRNSTFSPQIIRKNQTRFEGFDDKILAMYARGASTRDIQAQLQELNGVEESATLISNVTHEVLEEVKAWQSRELDSIYPIVYLDALVIKVHEDKRVINKAFYLALGVNMEGQKELLGIWLVRMRGLSFGSLCSLSFRIGV
jgi:putative transposase